MISENANMPIPIGISEIPLSSAVIPNVKRGMAETDSIPTEPISKPMHAAIKPRSMDPLPSPAIMVIAIQIRAKISGGPIYRATAANKEALIKAGKSQANKRR